MNKNFFITNKKLKSIYIGYSNLQTIQAGTFDSLNLDYLYLGYNKLKTIPTNLFKYQFILKELYLHNNEIKKLNAKEFKNLKNLERLGLEGNKGKVSAKEKDERKAKACDCGFECDLPDFIKNDEERAPTCFLK